MIENAAGHIDFFKSLQRNRMLSPCWILKGDRGIGKSQLVKQITKELLYHGEHQPHGMPNSFVDKQIEMNAYPNFFLLTPSISEDGTMANEINAETAKGVKLFLQSKPAIPGMRVVVIDSLDNMNRFAANSLLKILEEPPLNVCFLMICHQLGNILPTIRSRSKVLNINGEVENAFSSDFEFDQVLEAFFNDRFNNMESYIKSVVEKDKKLTNFRLMILKKVYSWISDVNHPTNVYSFFTMNHWINVYKALNQFFNAFDAAHLDPTQSLTAVFYLIKDPSANIFEDVMSPPF